MEDGLDGVALRAVLWRFVNERDANRPAVQAQGGATFGQPTQASIQSIFEEINMPPDAVLIDAGSGTGTVLFHAALLDGAPELMVGVEFMAAQHAEATYRLRRLQEDPALADRLASVQLYQRDILTLGVDDLYGWAQDRPLYIISFDARFPARVTAHMVRLLEAYARTHKRQSVTWISTFSTLGLESNGPVPDAFPQSVALVSRMTIGAPGVTEDSQPAPVFVVANQEENYPPDEWERIMEREDAKQMDLFRRAMGGEPERPQLEQFVIYSYRFVSKRARIEACAVCTQLTDLACEACETFYCGKACHNSTHKRGCPK